MREERARGGKNENEMSAKEVNEEKCCAFTFGHPHGTARDIHMSGTVRWKQDHRQ